MNILNAINNCEKEVLNFRGTIQSQGYLLVLDSEGIIQAYSENISEVFGSHSSLEGKSYSELINPNEIEELEGFSNIQSNISEEEQSTDSLPKAFHWKNYFVSSHMSDDLLLLSIEKEISDENKNLNQLMQVLSELNNIQDLEVLYSSCVAHIRALTGFERVMLYKFADNWDGHVVAEARDEDCESYMDLWFPASDIPKQARDLYKKTWIRCIHSVDAKPTSILPKNIHTIDLSGCDLRSVSPVHLEYLRNMNVGASMSIAVMHKGNLWGLIACHHRQERYVSPFERNSYKLYGQQLSNCMNILIREHNETYLKPFEDCFSSFKKSINKHSFLELMEQNSDTLLNAFQADGIYVRYGDQELSFGELNTDRNSSELLQPESKESIYYTDSIIHKLRVKDFPISEIAGFTKIALPSNPKDCILILRKEIAKTVHWGGNPESKVTTDPETGEHFLSPRLSFSAWSESREGYSKSWENEVIYTIHEFREILAEAIAFESSQKQSLQKGRLQMASIILHDLGNAITSLYNEVEDCLSNQSLNIHLETIPRLIDLLADKKSELSEIYGEDKCEALLLFLEETVKNMRDRGQEIKSSGESIRLAMNQINDLLSIHMDYSRAIDKQDTLLDLNEIIEDVITLMRKEIQAYDGSIILKKNSDFKDVRIDRTKLIHTLMNVFNNAFESHQKIENPTSKPMIEVTLAKIGNEFFTITITDNGQGFSEKESLEIINEGYSTKERSTGMGLTSCIKSIEAMGGKFNIQSQGRNQGATVTIKLPYEDSFHQ